MFLYSRALVLYFPLYIKKKKVALFDGLAEIQTKQRIRWHDGVGQLLKKIGPPTCLGQLLIV
jgi:hypothetical protein